MTKYKVGDKVTVRNDMTEGSVYGGLSFVDTMVDLRGKVVTIENADHFGYTIEGDIYNWTDEMFCDENNNNICDVVKQTIIKIGKKSGLSIQHTTNTKKENISIQRNGSKTGKIKFNEIDNLIELLNKLKSEVENEG